MAWKTWVQCWVESYQKLKKWYLMPPCLTLSIIRYGSRVKWSNPGKGVVPSPTPWCSSYQKESLQVTLDYDCQLYFMYCLKNKSKMNLKHPLCLTDSRIRLKAPVPSRSLKLSNNDPAQYLDE